MGDLLPFRRRRKTWTKPEDYGVVLPTATWRGDRPKRRRGWLRGLGWWLALIALCGAWVLYRDAIAFQPPAFLQGEPIKLAPPFTRCGTGRGPQCVVDGDTLKLGERRIRLVGLDAPEVRARCPAEALAAERATQALQRWANAGPFELVPRLDRPTDQYGRELMSARRPRPGGSDDAAAALIAQGVARPYGGEARAPWC